MARSRAKGTGLERIVKRHLEEDGYVVLRAAGSLGPIDSLPGPETAEESLDISFTSPSCVAKNGVALSSRPSFQSPANKRIRKARYLGALHHSPPAQPMTHFSAEYRAFAEA